MSAGITKAQKSQKEVAAQDVTSKQQQFKVANF